MVYFDFFFLLVDVEGVLDSILLVVVGVLFVFFFCWLLKVGELMGIGVVFGFSFFKLDLWFFCLILYWDIMVIM